MDGRASLSIAGTHLIAWPSPVALLKFASLFLLNPFLSYSDAVLFPPLSFHRPSTSKSRIRVCLSQREVAFCRTASYSPRVHPFGSFPPLFDSCLGCSLVRLLFFPSLWAFLHRHTFRSSRRPLTLFALVPASSIITVPLGHLYLTVFFDFPLH